MKIAGNIN